MAIAVAPPVTGLLERSALDLARMIRAGEVSSRAVVEAHAWRLHRCQPRTNALARDRFAAALAEADAADERIAAAGPDEQLPPFIGVPCTIKESIALVGMPNCAGLFSRRDHVAEETAPAAQRMLDAGFIPLGVTNTSELTLWIESDNRVYGRTRNAYDPHRIAGGSSGGEGAAVGSAGAPVGLGSDIGGSIRLPAYFNGVFGHKPTSGLVPNTGQFPTTEGEAARLLAIGPLARRAEDLMPVLRLIAGPDGRDGRCIPYELGDPEAVSFDGLRVVLAERTSLLPATKEVLAAREHAADALAAAGAKVERVPLTRLRRVLEHYVAAIAKGADVALTDLIADTGVQPGLRALLDAVRGRGPHTAQLMLTVISQQLNERLPQGRMERAVDAIDSLRDEVVEVIGDGVLLHQPFARVAPRHNTTIGRPWLLTPAAIFNLLGLPVTQVPLGLNEDGLPTGVQVAAAPGNDHLTIAAALELERRFGGWVAPPAPPA